MERLANPHEILKRVNRFMIVGQGSGNDTNVFTIMHYAVNANGEITADVY